MNVNLHIAEWVRVAAKQLVLLLFSMPVFADPRGEANGVFDGSITMESVDKFIADHPSGSLKKLVIASPGGDGSAGLKLGQWVKQNNLDVQVRFICMSACANYVFLAGRNKIIEPGALVLWHGSVEQKDLRELMAKYIEILLKKIDDSTQLTREEDDFLKKNKANFNTLVSFREAQARFFDSIQTNEYITRLGQEPIDFGIEAWTTTVHVMEKFGIANVDAPNGYGKLSYVKGHPLMGLFNKGQYLSFDLDERGEVRRVE